MALYCFIILHYMAYKTTCDCANKILSNFNNSKIEIVIVDNASPNGSGKKLKSYYQKKSNVHVILNQTNSGFAGGNNIGYKYIKQSFNAEYIIDLNNDVFINDPLFIKKILRIHSKTNFDVLGPDIYCQTSLQHQSPLRLKGISKKELKFYHKSLEKVNRFFEFYYYKNRLLDKLHLSKSSNTSDIQHVPYNQTLLNPVLYGACYIFSRNFINKRKYAFNPATFMFFEEEILQYECLQKNLKIIYSPEVQVIHLDDIATNLIYKKHKSNYLKEKNKRREILKSVNVLMNLINSNEKD